MNTNFAKFGNWVGIMSAFAVTCSIGYNLYQQTQITRLKQINELVKTKESLVNDSFNEILMNRISELRDNLAETNRNQGRVEGMVAASMNLSPQQNQVSAIWHEGYNRGLEQLAMVEESAYISGYHRATEDLDCPASVKEKMNNDATRRYQQDKKIDIESQEFNKALDEAQKRRDNIDKLKKIEDSEKDRQSSTNKPESK
jgi:hypothetical protein